MSKFKIGDEVKIISHVNMSPLKTGEICTIVDILTEHKSFPIIIKNEEGIADAFCEDELEIYKKDLVEEYSFAELMNNIKSGEVWTDNIYEITKDLNGIAIKRIDKVIQKDSEGNHLMYFWGDRKFTISRETYSFKEAFKEYENGIEIESYFGFKYRKIKDKDMVKNEDNIWRENDEGFSLGEIRHLWFVNK